MYLRLGNMGPCVVGYCIMHVSSPRSPAMLSTPHLQYIYVSGTPWPFLAS